MFKLYLYNIRSVFNAVKTFSLKKKSATKTLLFSYIGIVLVCMMAIGFISFRYESIIKEENENLSRHLFAGVSQSVRETMNDIRVVNKQIVGDSELQTVAEEQQKDKYWSAESALKGIENLKHYAENQKSIDLVFVYLKMSDEVVSIHGILSSDMFYGLYFENSGISYEDWLAILRNNEKETYLNLKYNIDSESRAAIALLSPLSRKNNAVSVIMTDKRSFLHYTEQLDVENVFDIFIYNSFGRLIIYEKNTDSEEIPYTFSEIEWLMEHDSDSVYKVAETQGVDDWYVAMVVPENIHSSKIFLMRLVVFIFSVIALAILVVLIRFSIRQNTSYIKMMSSVLNVDSTDNEYQSLFASLEKVLGENRSLRREQIQKDEYLRRMLLSRIIKGDMTAFSEIVKYNISFSLPCFAVITFYLENVETLFADMTEMSSSERKEYLQLIISNIFEEKFKDDNIQGYVTETDGLSVCLLNINTDGQDRLSEIKGLAEECVSFINQNFNIELSFALSGIYDEPKGIADAYVKTLEALEYKKRLGIEGSLLYNDISFDYSDGYLFNLDRENTLIRAIKRGQLEEAKEVVDHVFRLLESKPSFSTEYVYYTVQDILRVITKTATEMSGVEVNVQRELELSQKLTTLTIPQMHMMICEHLTEICTFMEEKSKDVSKENINPLILHVKEYVEKNYKSPLLNISTIGDHFNMSPYYLSKLFKEETGITLIDYLNGCRIKHAKELMENSDLSSKAIAENVGFNHVRTFYRLLKKHIEE